MQRGVNESPSIRRGWYEKNQLKGPEWGSRLLHCRGETRITEAGEVAVPTTIASRWRGLGLEERADDGKKAVVRSVNAPLSPPCESRSFRFAFRPARERDRESERACFLLARFLLRHLSTARTPREPSRCLAFRFVRLTVHHHAPLLICVSFDLLSLSFSLPLPLFIPLVLSCYPRAYTRRDPAGSANTPPMDFAANFQ